MGMRVAGIPRIPREIRVNGERCCGNIAAMEPVAAGIPPGWNLFMREARGNTLETFPMKKNLGESVEY